MTRQAPRWMSATLCVAGVYNLAWGLFSIAFPNALFRWAEMEPPRYPELWQCIGMIVGVYGIGYLAAARDPLRHWPITLVGLLGKIFGPIGFGIALLKGTLPPAFGMTILTNDLIWWVPFGMILWASFRELHRPLDTGNSARSTSNSPEPSALTSVVGDRGETLEQMSREGPVLVVSRRIPRARGQDRA